MDVTDEEHLAVLMTMPLSPTSPVPVPVPVAPVLTSASVVAVALTATTAAAADTAAAATMATARAVSALFSGQSNCPSKFLCTSLVTTLVGGCEEVRTVGRW